MYAWRVDTGRDATFAWGTCIKSAGIEDVGAKGDCIGDASSCASGTYIEDTCARNTCAGDAGIRDTSAAGARGIGGVDVLKDLGIHSRLSQILELKWYSSAWRPE